MAAPLTHLKPGPTGAIVAEGARDARQGSKALGAAANDNLYASEKAAQVLESVSSKAFLPQMIGFIGAMALTPVGWVAGKLGGAKAKTYVQMPMAAVAALDEIKLGALHQAPAKFMGAVAAKAQENGADALQQSASRTAAELSRRGEMAASALGAKIAPASRGVAGAWSAVEARADAARGANGLIAKLADWRAGRLDKAAANTAAALKDAHAYEAVGLMGRVKQFVVGAPRVQAAGSIDIAQPLLRVANGNAVQASGLRQSVETFQAGLGSATLNASQQARAGAVLEKATKLASIIEKKAFWDSAKTGGLGAVVRNVPKVLGNLSLGRALILTGVAASSAALILRTKAENGRADETLKNLAADIYGVDVSRVNDAMISGAQAPELLKRAAVDVSKSGRGNWMAGAASLAGEGMWLMPNMSMAPAMLMGSMSGFAKDLFTSENPYLSAYKLLKAEAKGQGTMKPEQKLQLVTMLVGASPAISAHGGARNKLAKPIASQMLDERLSVEQMLRELANPQAIELRAVKAKEAALAKETAHAEVKPSDKPAVQATHTLSPGTKVGAIQPHGRVVQSELSANR